MKKIFVLIIMISLFGIKSSNANIKVAYDYSFKDLDGQELNLSEFKEKVIVIIKTVKTIILMQFGKIMLFFLNLFLSCLYFFVWLFS